MTNSRDAVDRPRCDAVGSGLDAAFAVNFVHRLRITRDVVDPENPTLAEIIDAPRGPARLVALIDDGVAAAWPEFAERLGAYAAAHAARLDLVLDPIVVPGGERAKNDRVVYEQALEAIDAGGICRQSYVLVVGGGAVLDAVGFAASTAHRGVRLVRVPSTTLAQADGGLGVKNGINAFGKKNFLGAFSVPWAVINDVRLLESLSDRDFRCGFSEAIKVGLIKDAALFREVVENAGAIARREMPSCERIVRRSAELHLEHIVSGGDPFELTASRPLDFGHWSGHKLEQMSGFDVRHGEAVAIGIALDVVYSAEIGLLEKRDADTILRSMHELGFALSHPCLAETDTLLEGLDEFREHLGGELTIMLLRGIGKPVEVHEMDKGRLSAAVAALAAWTTSSGTAAAG